MKIDQYLQPKTLQEAFQLLAADPKNQIVAGGAWMKLADPEILTAIDLSKLGLDQVSATKDVVEIGSMTTLRTLETELEIQSLYDGILSEAAGMIMGIPIRDIATIGGTVMGRLGFSDLLAPLIAMQARLVFFDHPEMTLAAFLETKGPLRDILVKIIIPKVPGHGYFHKVARTALDFAVLNVAMVSAGPIFRIVLGARPGAAVEAVKAGIHLSTTRFLDPKAFLEVARIAAQETAFGSNQKATADYRKHLAEVYVGRGLKELMSREN